MTRLFDQLIDREGTWSEKWDTRQQKFSKADVFPMWVADMDLPSPPCVVEEIEHRLKHPVFGYIHIPDDLADCVASWQFRQHQWVINPDSVCWLSGAVDGLYLSVATLTQPKDAVMVLTPVYAPFMQSITNQDRQLVEVPLRLVQSPIGLLYELDWHAIEQAIKQHSVKLLLFSNPHNPSGRVWSYEELSRLAELCLRYQVKLVSDEVWSDLIMQTSSKHVPLAHVSSEVAQACITLSSASKTFNLAALNTAYAMIENVSIRDRFLQVSHRSHATGANLFGLVALQAVYGDQGADWLSALLVYLRKNVQLAQQVLLASMPELKVIMPQSGYLLWIDCRAYFDCEDRCHSWWINQAHLGLTKGTEFGRAGNLFMRMNVACHHESLVLALSRLLQLSLDPIQGFKKGN